MKKRANEILDILDTVIVDKVCELNYSNDLEFLIAIMLSAQTTDKKVNMVTKELFQKYKSLDDYLMADFDDILNILKPLGLANTKTKNLIELCKDLKENYSSNVPNKFDDLIKLKGVGEKTASVFLSIYYNMPYLAVDTHVMRVSRRLGLTKNETANKVMKDLMNIYDKSKFKDVHQIFVLFGRYHCKSISPNCLTCKVKDYCNYYKGDYK